MSDTDSFEDFVENLPFAFLPWDPDDESDPRECVVCDLHMKEVCEDCRQDFSLLNDLRYDPHYLGNAENGHVRMHRIWTAIRDYYTPEHPILAQDPVTAEQLAELLDRTNDDLTQVTYAATMCYAAHWVRELRAELPSALKRSLQSLIDMPTLPGDEERIAALVHEESIGLPPIELAFQEIDDDANNLEGGERKKLVCATHSSRMCDECQMDFSLMNRLRYDPGYHHLVSDARLADAATPRMWMTIRSYYLVARHVRVAPSHITQQEMDTADPITSMAYKCYAAHSQGDMQQDILDAMQTTLEGMPGFEEGVAQLARSIP